MKNTRPMSGHDKVNPNEKGANNLEENDCCECKEGCVLGETVYCSIDGRFHPLRDNCLCKSFRLLGDSSTELN